MRMIFVGIRGVNYSSRAFQEVGRDIDVLVKEQQRLRQQATVLFSAGIMWTAFAGLAIFAISKIVSASAEGRRAMSSLGRATNELMKALSESFMKVLGPAIQMLTVFFRLLSRNEPLLRLITILTTLGITMIIIKGASMFLGAALNYVAASSLGLSAAGATTAATGLNLLYIGLLKIQVALGPLLLGFILGAQLASLLGRNMGAIIAIITALTIATIALAAALWSAGYGLSILTFGGAAIAGVAAMAYAQTQMPSYQHGTEYVRRTTPAIIHEGERITSARERVTAREVGEVRPYPVRKILVDMSGMTVHTKADKEELRPFILKTVRDATDNRV